jgi:hypothetical protein
MAAPSEAADLFAVAAHHQPEAVMLDFMDHRTLAARPATAGTVC